MKKLLIAILFMGSYTGYLMGAEGKKLVLHPVAAGEVGGAVATVHGWYKDAWASDENIYKIAKIDLNGDGIQEMIVYMSDFRCQKNKKTVCSMFIMRKSRKQANQWDKISGFIKAKEVRILPTATMGWYDLRFDDTLYVYSKYSAVGSYSKGEKPGQLVMSKSDLNTQTIEHFGLSWELDGDWISKGQKKTFKSYQEGYSNYEGYFPGANKRVSVSVSVSPKKTVEAFVKYHSDGTPFKLTPIGSGKINGHGVKVYWLSWGSTGEVYLRFDEEEYFVDPADKNSDLFPMHIYVNISGKLFYDLKHEAIQHVLDRYVTPFLHTLKVTELHTFATDTGEETIPLHLVYTADTLDKREASETRERAPKSDVPIKKETHSATNSKPNLSELEKSCYGGDGESCYRAGMEYLYTKENDKLAKGYFDISCDMGNERACIYFAAAIQDDSSAGKASKTDAIKSLQKYCSKKNGFACAMLSEIYKQGKDIKKDMTLSKDYNLKAFVYLKNSCDGQDNEQVCRQRFCGYDLGIDCMHLGMIYMDKNIDNDALDNKTLYYLNKSCNYKTSASCAILGSEYSYNGNTSFYDLQKAENYYRVACELGHKRSCLEAKKLKQKSSKVKMIKSGSKIYDYNSVLEIIKNGTGSMPPGMAKDIDAQKVARYVSDGMQGEKPAAFAVCASCHGENGKGIDGVGPSLKNLKQLMTHGKKSVPKKALTKKSVPYHSPAAARKYEGAWFEIKYPGNFRVIPSIKSKTNIKGYDSVFFASPDKDVYFYVFSPQWNGKPNDILLKKNVEKMLSCKKRKKDGVLFRYCTVKAKDGSYYKYYEDIEDPRINTRHVFGILYRDRKTYDRYKALYGKFKKSLEQFSN